MVNLEQLKGEGIVARTNWEDQVNHFLDIAQPESGDLIAWPHHFMVMRCESTPSGVSYQMHAFRQ